MSTPLRPIALVGISGAGKSAVAALLAARRGGEAADLDARIEARAGRSIPELFAARGEAAFRVLETQALADAIAEGAGVIACGGGAPEVEASRALLSARCRVVWLEVTPAEAARRVGAGRDRRPLLRDGDLAGRLAELLARRGEFYRSLATLRVATDGLTPDQVADSIARGLAGESAA